MKNQYRIVQTRFKLNFSSKLNLLDVLDSSYHNEFVVEIRRWWIPIWYRLTPDSWFGFAMDIWFQPSGTTTIDPYFNDIEEARSFIDNHKKVGYKAWWKQVRPRPKVVEVFND